MTYTPLKPDGGPSPLLDAPIIQTNFSQFGSIFAKNHKGLNDKNRGKHENVIFSTQTTDPVVEEDQADLFSKDATSKQSTEPQLFYKIPKFLPTDLDITDADNLAVQLTYNSSNIIGPVYQSFLAGGYIFYLGFRSGNTVPNANTTLNVILTPAPTKLIVALASSNFAVSSVPIEVSTVIDTILNDRFQITAGTAGLGVATPYRFSWLAIGIA